VTTDDTATRGEALARRARLGVIALAIRTVVVQLSIFAGDVALARLLEPGDYGAFGIVRFALSFFVIFGDVGLGGALIRQKEEPTEEQLSTVFFAQLGLALALVAVIAVVSPYLGRVWTSLPPSSPWLMRALAVDLVFTACRIVPSLLMERNLEFGRLAVVEVVVQLSFYVVAVATAALGWRMWALATGVLAQALVSLIAIHRLRPWRPRLHFDRALVTPLLRYGLPFQAKNLVAMANGAVTPLYAGSMLGSRAVGLINWAQSTAYWPMKLVEIMARVDFPLYSRMQDDKQLFARTLGRSVQLCSVATLGFVSIVLGLGPAIVGVVYGEKWLPAVPYLYIFAAAFSVGFLAPVVGAAFDAVGRPGVFFRLSVFWTALNWAVVLLTTPRWGAVGFVGGYVVHMIVGNLIVARMVRDILPDVRVWPRVRASIVAALVTLALGYWGIRPWAGTPLTLGPAILLCLGCYVLVMVALERTIVGDFVSFFRREAHRSPVPARTGEDDAAAE
jgi:O-antigen/teichoic acid export membrane protein